ncbi:MAG: efflux RND transporter periplasmic adaptor subunit [Myxococcota bacterium]
MGRFVRFARSLGACALLLGPLACSDDSGAAQSARRGPRTVPVVIQKPTKHEFVDRIEALGTAGSNESIVVSAQVTETVSRVHFEDGQDVAKGDVLVELTSREESAQLDAVRSALGEAQRQYERAAEMSRNGTLSEAQLDARTTARDAAQARLDELRARMRDRLIRAPFSGVLGMRSVSPGTLVQPGAMITTLDDIDVIKIDFGVPERFLSVLSVDLVVRSTTAAYPDRIFEGTVRAIDPRVDPDTRSVRVRADLLNPEHELRPGMLVSVELTANRKTGLAIPEEAIVPIGERRFVFIVTPEKRVDRIELTTGRRDKGLVEVLAGLGGEESVVLEGGSMLSPGSAVEIVPRGPRQGDALSEPGARG